ncbi:DUF4349 domain-containing protein [Microbacterium sp. Mu-80]|uniref:DUF4349 domain-containing protein n=1 Tax=Microbacterium bandirmense TaxID=3122050 RepID=A0ABU8L9F9_9MICO
MTENGDTTLAPLSEASIARIEHAVFDEIDRGEAVVHPESAAPARSTRRRRWVTGLGIAAAFVGGILIAPPLLNAVSPTGAGSSVQYDAETSGEAPIGVPESAELAPADGMAADSAAGGAVSEDADAGREIISTAEATVRVEDVAGAVDAITDLAAEHDGYVEATDVGLVPDAAAQVSPGPPTPPGSGWISIRVPAEDLTEVMSALDAHGEVLRSSISRTDVTSTVVDLQARVEASRASVQRLTELMSKSGSVGDLIAAESALSERQAQLESYEQQLKALDEQVTMSSLSIRLTEQTTATTADPAGFADGLLAGWNGLIVSLNALVVALGFLLPWLVIAGAVVLVIWLVRRRRKGRPESHGEEEESA